MNKRDEVTLPKLTAGRYLHTKSGHYYEVIGVALQTETNEPMVVYRPLWESKYQLFTRPYEIFVEHVEIDGVMRPRFEKVSDQVATIET